MSRLLSANSAENPLKIPTGISCVILLDLTKSSSAKTAVHPTARIFALDFCADDEGLLAQAEEEKEKYKQKDRCGAVGVRLPTAYLQADYTIVKTRNLSNNLG